MNKLIYAILIINIILLTNCGKSPETIKIEGEALIGEEQEETSFVLDKKAPLEKLDKEMIHERGEIFSKSDGYITDDGEKSIIVYFRSREALTISQIEDTSTYILLRLGASAYRDGYKYIGCALYNERYIYFVPTKQVFSFWEEDLTYEEFKNYIGIIEWKKGMVKDFENKE